MTISLAAGDVLTAARFNALVPMYVAQGSDQSLTTSATNWNAGAISLDASSIWIVTYFFDAGNASVAGNDFRPTFVLTGGSTIGRIWTLGPSSGETNAAVAANMAVASRAVTTVSFGLPSSTTIRSIIRIDLQVTSTTAGTLIPQVAMSAGTGTLYAGSYVIAHRVS